MGFFMFPFGFFSWIFPFLLIFLGVRIIRRLIGRSHWRGRRDLDWDEERFPFDNYPSRTLGSGTSIPQSMESQIFKIAYQRKGRITISDLVIETGLTMKEAEQRMKELTDGVHVRMEVTRQGIVVYEFPEIIDRFENS